MEFTLVYQGPLKANGGLTDKQSIRRVFHMQLAKLWQQVPLVHYGPPRGSFLDDTPPPSKVSIIQRVGAFRFAPLVCSKLQLVARLSIVMLRPEPPGSIITAGGDIDNRLKTLFDALRMPKATSEIPSGDAPQSGEDPFFCLLEDDNLIVKVSVDTDRWLDPNARLTDVHLLLHVTTKALVATYANTDFG